MTSRLPKRGRPKVPGKTRRILLREATFELWNARRETTGILGLTNSQFAEMLLRQEPKSCERCGQQADTRQRRTSRRRELFQSTPLRTRSVPVAIELSLSPVQEHGDKSDSLVDITGVSDDQNLCLEDDNYASSSYRTKPKSDQEGLEIHSSLQ